MENAFQAVQAFRCGGERLPGLPVLQSPRPRLQSALAAVGDFSMSSFQQAPPLAGARPELGVAPLPAQPPPPAVPQVQGPPEFKAPQQFKAPELESPELEPPQFKAPQLPTTKKPQAKQCAKKSVEEATSLVLSAMASKSEAKVATAVKKRPAATPPNDVNSRNSRKPHFSVEHSRSQVMFRTGLAGQGQSTAFKYHDAASKALAIKKAKVIVEKESANRRTV